MDHLVLQRGGDRLVTVVHDVRDGYARGDRPVHRLEVVVHGVGYAFCEERDRVASVGER